MVYPEMVTKKENFTEKLIVKIALATLVQSGLKPLDDAQQFTSSIYENITIVASERFQVDSFYGLKCYQHPNPGSRYIVYANHDPNASSIKIIKSRLFFQLKTNMFFINHI